MSTASSDLELVARGKTGGNNGVLLVNLGTPRGPSIPEVREYLREFLSDPNVIDIHPLAKKLLLHLYILPFRPRVSAAAYSKIWTEEGSPLLVHGRNLTREVVGRLDKTVPVVLGMRYGEPGIPQALRELKEQDVQRVLVLPLYPQYADSTVGSTMDRVHEVAQTLWTDPDVVALPLFYDHPGFVRALAAVGSPVLASEQPDHILMSYHGLPERHLHKTDPSGAHCLKDGCCDSMSPANQNCYRAHCFETSRLLARELDLSPEDYTVCFQSRLGRAVWISPYTDQVLKGLAEAGKETLAVFCPSFVADCLETLEEIAIRGQEQFQEAGGKKLTLIPSLNSHPVWADAVTEMIDSRLREGART